MLQKILFTHDDLDGAGCRIVFELANKNLEKGKDYLVVNCGNTTIDSDIAQTVMNARRIGYDPATIEIWFADIVCSMDTLQWLRTQFDIINIFDHHRTNFPAQQIVFSATIVPENEMGVMQSGTSLLYQNYAALYETGKDLKINCIDLDFLDPEKYDQKRISRFVDLVRSYDTYEWKETNNIEAKQLQTLFFILGMERFCAKYVAFLTSQEDTDKIISDNDMEFVSAKLEMEQRVIDNISPDDVYEIDIRGHKTAFMLGSRGANISELSHQFLEKYPDFEIFAGFLLGKSAEFSFRTISEELDLGAEIASPIGGGGHPKASGAPLSGEALDKIVDLLIQELNR